MTVTKRYSLKKTLKKLFLNSQNIDFQFKTFQSKSLFFKEIINVNNYLIKRLKSEVFFIPES